MSVTLVSVTPDAEKTIGYIARVSNPNNQDNPKVAGLLKYCIKHQHWSIFEQASMTLQIETTRAIAAQILRHRSFTFQEFSQRYADSSMLGEEIPMVDLRRQDDKNRQNSIDDIDPFIKQELEAGFFQNVRMAIPASITIQSGLNTPRYPSLKGIMGAKKKEIKTLDIDSSDQSLKISKLYLPSSSNEITMIDGSSDQIVESLVKVFKSEIKI